MADPLAPLWIEAATTVEGPATIDANGRGHAVFVVADDIDVVLRGLLLVRGHGELGAGLRVEGDARVTVEDCAFEGNRGAQGGANGAGVGRGTVRFVRCRFGAGQDLLLTGGATVELVDCEIASDVRVREAARVTLTGGRVGGRLDVAGTTTHAPTVRIAGAAIDGGVHNDAIVPGEIAGT